MLNKRIKEILSDNRLARGRHHSHHYIPINHYNKKIYKFYILNRVLICNIGI